MIGILAGRAPTSVADEVWLRFQPVPPIPRARVGLNEAIDEVLVEVRSAIAKNRVAVSTHLMDGLVPIQGDRVQLQQVVVNLTLNAVEAMGSVEDGVRELSIRTEQSQTGAILSQCTIQGLALIREISTPESEWVYRSADPSSTATGAGCG